MDCTAPIVLQEGRWAISPISLSQLLEIICILWFWMGHWVDLLLGIWLWLWNASVEEINLFPYPENFAVAMPLVKA